MATAKSGCNLMSNKIADNNDKTGKFWIQNLQAELRRIGNREYLQRDEIERIRGILDELTPTIKRTSKSPN